MITVWVNFKDGSNRYIDCRQATHCASGDLIIQYDNCSREKIRFEDIDFYGVWEK